MKVMLVDKDNGAERGWIEFSNRRLHIACKKLEEVQNVVTLPCFCGIQQMLQEPPEQIDIE